MPDQEDEWESFQTDDAKLEEDVQDILARSPGARRISSDEIEIAPDLIMKLSSVEGGGVGNVQDQHCPFGFVCVFSNRDFGGSSLRKERCGEEWNLGRIPFPGGGTWSDKVSSIINNQSARPNRTAFFYDFAGSGKWDRILSVNQGSFLRNLALDTAEGGGTPNDRIDGMHICGVAPSPWVPNMP